MRPFAPGDDDEMHNIHNPEHSDNEEKIPSEYADDPELWQAIKASMATT